MRKALVGWALFLVGIYLTLRVTAQVIYEVEDYQPGSADCDQCGITILLDNIVVMAAAAVAYLSLAGLVARARRRARRKGTAAPPAV